INMSTSFFLFLLLISPLFSFYHDYEEREQKYIDDSPLTKQLIEEGFIRKPETGHPRVTCVIRNHKEPRGMAKLEECYAIPQVSEVSVGCFALWNETEGYLHQGCSNQHDVAFRGDNCQKGACIKSRMVAKEFKYCCCYGDECNANPIDLGSL
ncbi:hypothetical protein PENTCL1PPCAC_26260, partial [Pristionchus entomophagus]